MVFGLRTVYYIYWSEKDTKMCSVAKTTLLPSINYTRLFLVCVWKDVKSQNGNLTKFFQTLKRESDVNNGVLKKKKKRGLV